MVYGKLLVMSIITSIMVFYISDIYMPNDFERPYEYKARAFYLKAFSIMGKIGSFLNLGSEIVVFRKVIDYATLLEKYFKKTDGSVTLEDTLYDDIHVRIYTPKKLQLEKFHPFMIYFHGGFYLFSNIDSYDDYLYNLAKQTNLIIISVDYKMAPENPFPGPLEDCIRVTKYILNNYEKMHLDINRYALAGDSAGGHATAATTQYLLEKGYILPKMQILIYPWVQMYDFMLPSNLNYHTKDFISNAKFSLGEYMWWLLGVQENITEDMKNIFKENRQTLFLNDTNLKVKFQEYLDIDLIPEMYKTDKSYYKEYKNLKEKNNAQLKELSEKYQINENHAEMLKKIFTKEANPGLSDANVLKKLPKTYFLVLEWDTLKDQCLIYAERLKANNVPVKIAFYENVYHGMVPFINNKTGYGLSRKMSDDLIEYIKENI